MSRIGKPLSSIDWSTFNNLKPVDFRDYVIEPISNSIDIIKQLEPGSQQEQQDIQDFEILMFSIAGIDSKTNSEIPQSLWYSAWISQAETNLYAAQLLIILNKVYALSTSNIKYFIDQMDYIGGYVLIRYFSNPIPEGFPNAGNYPLLVSNTEDYYNRMTDVLYDFFYNEGRGIFGLGNYVINELCSNFSRDTVGSYKPILNWCGCFSKDDQITIDAKEKYPNSASYSKACDPLCIANDSIKLVQSATDDAPFTNQECTATFCIMTKFSISTTDSDGIINLNQICPCSKNQSCFCIIDSTIEGLLNRVRANDGGSMSDPISFKQYCPGARCIVQNKDGTTTEVECQQDNPNGTNQIHGGTQDLYNLGPNIWMIFLILLGAITSLILCARYIGFEPKYNIKGVLKPKVTLSKYTKSSDIGLIKK